MTATTRAAMTSAVIGGLVTIAGTLLLGLTTGFLDGKENVTSHNADVAELRSVSQGAIGALDAKLQRVLDAVCYDKPQAPVCK